LRLRSDFTAPFSPCPRDGESPFRNTGYWAADGDAVKQCDGH